MKWIAFSLVLLNARAFAGGPDAAQAPVGVYLEFEHASPVNLRPVLESEVQNILAPLGFNIQWRDIGAAGKEAWVDLALLMFRGHCDLASTAVTAFVPGALGETHITDGIIQPFADIDCDRIGSLVRPRMAAFRARDRDRLFQRAIARVVAHELYHVFVRTTEHEPTGVGKAEFTADDLLSDRFQFHRAQAQALLKSSADDVLQLSLGAR